MNSSDLLPSWLHIVRIDDRHFQVTDTSVASIGLCLGVFSCREAAETIASKIARSRVASKQDFDPSLLRGSNASLLRPQAY
jgi:hypothetical protein